jgi:steroid delta-isomerase-like uncharacterized protein
MTLEAIREVMTAYLDGHDLTRLAADAVFHDTATGREAVGRDAIAEMLEGWYHGAFEAHSDTKRLIVADGAAVLQAEFIGTHIGEFSGIPATGRQVRVPFCVVYDVTDGAIRRADIYLQAAMLMAQLGAGDIREGAPA